MASSAMLDADSVDMSLKRDFVLESGWVKWIRMQRRMPRNGGSRASSAAHEMPV